MEHSSQLLQGGYSRAVMEAAERISQHGGTLTPAERRVAEIVLASPQLVAFGTVADLADAAHSGAATVVRLATKLGYDGFTSLQAAVQRDVARQLLPAAVRIREPASDDQLTRHMRIELGNVDTTLGGIDPVALADVVDHLANLDVGVFVISGDASRGVAQQLVGELSALRDRVALLDGNEVSVRRQISLLRAGDVVITVDLRRYDRWVIEAARAAAAGGAWCVAVADSVLSPLAGVSRRTMVVAAGSAGPFDSHVGTLALFNVLVAAVAERLRTHAADRLDRMELAWRESNALTDR